MRELFVDNFAGGGGASTGIEMAIGRSVDIAINHDPSAIAMHTVNHPDTRHYCEDVWEVSPTAACNGNPVALAWFSPDCRHFSRAKGGKPVDKNIRGLAWVVLRWAYEVRPRVIMLENVVEIQTWGPLDKNNKPIKDRAGETFAAFIGALSDGIPYTSMSAVTEMCEALEISVDSDMCKALCKGLGYKVEYRELLSCDYGAPTKRNRFYIVARSDGKEIVWPKATHAKRGSPKQVSGELPAWRSAAECIDWSIPTKSIFDRKKPLAEATLKRIARGIQKFVIDNPDPFIINYKFDNGPEDINNPLSTVTAVNSHYVVTPTIMCNNTGNAGASVDSPLPTVTTGNRNFLVAPSIVPVGYGEREGQKPRVHDIEEPLSTVVGSTVKQNLVTPILIQYHSETSEDPRGQKLSEPVATLDTSNRYGLVCSFINKYYAGHYQGAGSDIAEPLHTITAEPRHYLAGVELKPVAAASGGIVTLRKNETAHDVREPITTISTSGAHHMNVLALLAKYGSEDVDRLGIVNIHGEEYIITDIQMRMLQPSELFKCNGFPDDYIIDRDADGNPYPKSQQVAKCGNAVTPPVSKALVMANLPEYCKEKTA